VEILKATRAATRMNSRLRILSLRAVKINLCLILVLLVAGINSPPAYAMAADAKLASTTENYIGVRYNAALLEDELSETQWVLLFGGNGLTRDGEYEPHFLNLMIKGGWVNLYDDGVCASGFPQFRERRSQFTLGIGLDDYENHHDIAAWSQDPTLFPRYFTNIDSTDPRAPDMIAADYQVDRGGSLEGREIEVSLVRGEVTRLPQDKNYFMDPDNGCKPNAQADILYRHWIATLNIASLGITRSIDFYLGADHGDKILGANTLNFMWESPGPQPPAIKTDKFKVIVFDPEVQTTSGEWKKATRFLVDLRTPRSELPYDEKGQLVGGYRKVNYNGQSAIEASFGYGYADYVVDANPYDIEPTDASKAVIDLERWEGTFDFSLTNSGGITLGQGGTGSNSITANLLSGSTESVSLSCVGGLPAGASCSFSPTSASPSFASTLTINTLSTTPTGSYPITILGYGAAVYRGNTFVLTVNPAQPIARVDVSASPNPVEIESGGNRPVTYSFAETNGVGVHLTSRDWVWILSDGSPFDGGSASNDVNVAPRSSASWVNTVYLPPDVVQRSQAIGSNSSILSTTFHGIDSNDNDIDAEVRLTINTAPIHTSLTISFSPQTVDIGTSPPGTTTISAVLTPSVYGKTILVYQSKGSSSGPWNLISSGQTDGSGRYGFSWQPPETGTYFFKTEFPGDASYSASSAISEPNYLVAIPEFSHVAVPWMVAVAILFAVLIRYSAKDTRSNLDRFAGMN